MTKDTVQAGKQPDQVTLIELAQKICRLLRVEGTTPIELSLLRNGSLLVTKIPDSAERQRKRI
jgi:hypothetical protein